MNALVDIRANATGLLSPTQAERQEVIQKFQENLLVRQGARIGAANLAEGQSVLKAGDGSSVPLISQAANDDLDRDAFLRLLVLQLQNQDPLDPVSNHEMLSQLAQFSALEQLNNLTDQFEVLSGNIDQLNFISAQGLLGRTVRGIDINGEPREGVVTSIALNGSIVVLTVDGVAMTMSGVLEIDAGPTTEDGA